MPASPTDFELQLLQLIWETALLLALLAVLVPVGLVLRRKYEEWRESLRTARRAELSKFIYASLRPPLAVALKNLPELGPGDEPLVMRIVLDLLRVMRGTDRERIVQIVKSWNMFAYLRQLAETGVRGKRIQALTLLGHFDDTESLVVLMGHAGAKDMYVQLAALRCLAERGATKYIGQIIDKLQLTRKTNALMLADILGRFGEKALAALVKLLQSRASTDVRVAAIMAIDRIGSLETIEPLLQVLNDADAEIRAQAVCTLGKLGDVKAGPALAHCLEDENKEVRLQAAVALGKLSDQRALPALTRTLNDKDWWVRFRCAQALYKSGNNGIAMLKSLSQIKNDAGILAAQVLGEMGDHDARHPRAA